MGNNIQNICKNNSYCLKQEIKKIETNDLNDSTIKLSKKKTPKFNNFQITSVISESIIDQKKEDFDKKSIPLNQDFSLDNNLSIITISVDEEKNNSEKSFEKEKLDDIKLTKSSSNIFKKTLFNKQSIRSLKQFKKIFTDKYEKLKEEEEKEDEEIQNIVITYEGQLCTFNGELINENPLEGKGLLKLNSGEILEGTFIEGKLNKYGKYIDINGTIFEGDFKNGKLEGKAKIIKFKDNKKIYKIKYFGDIKDFKKEGFGEEECDDYIYEGNFHNDMKEGNGRIEFKKLGDIYEGEFKNDKINGYGVYKWKNKSEYTGYFINGKINGKGKYKWPDGNEYEGIYVNGIREGIGKMKCNDGRIVNGVFKNGKPNGRGTIEYNGVKYAGIFKKGKFEKFEGNIL